MTENISHECFSCAQHKEYPQGYCTGLPGCVACSNPPLRTNVGSDGLSDQDRLQMDLELAEWSGYASAVEQAARLVEDYNADNHEGVTYGQIAFAIRKLANPDK